MSDFEFLSQKKRFDLNNSHFSMQGGVDEYDLLDSNVQSNMDSIRLNNFFTMKRKSVEQVPDVLQMQLEILKTDQSESSQNSKISDLSASDPQLQLKLQSINKDNNTNKIYDYNIFRRMMSKQSNPNLELVKNEPLLNKQMKSCQLQKKLNSQNQVSDVQPENVQSNMTIRLISGLKSMYFCSEDNSILLSARKDKNRIHIYSPKESKIYNRIEVVRDFKNELIESQCLGQTELSENAVTQYKAQKFNVCRKNQSDQFIKEELMHLKKNANNLSLLLVNRTMNKTPVFAVQQSGNSQEKKSKMLSTKNSKQGVNSTSMITIFNRDDDPNKSNPRKSKTIQFYLGDKLLIKVTKFSATQLNVVSQNLSTEESFQISLGLIQIQF